MANDPWQEHSRRLELALTFLGRWVDAGPARWRQSVLEDAQELLARELPRVQRAQAESELPATDPDALPEGIESAVEGAVTSLQDPVRSAAWRHLGFDPRLRTEGKTKREDCAAEALGRKGRWYRTPAKEYGGLKPGAWVIEQVAGQLATDLATVAVRADAPPDGRGPAVAGATSDAAQAADAGAPSAASLSDRFMNENYVHNSERFKQAMREARSLAMLGFSHSRMMANYKSELIALLNRGGQLRVVAMDPACEAVIDANARSSAPKSSDQAARYQYEAAIAELSSIRDTALGDGAFEMRLMDCMPPYTIYLFNEDDPGAELYVWLTPWRVPSSHRPGFRLSRDFDERWYPFFVDQFNVMWNSFPPALAESDSP